MKKEELQKLVETSTKEGVIDFDVISEKVNESINGIVAKNVAKEVENAKPNAVNEAIKGLGIDGIDTLDAFKSYADNIKKSATDKDVELTKLTKTQKELETRSVEFESKFNEANKKLTSIERKELLRDKEIHKDHLDDFLLLAETKITEDNPFDKVVEDMLGQEKYKMFMGVVKNASGRSGGLRLTQEQEQIEIVRKAAGLK